jgi:hypothetical protein
VNVGFSENETNNRLMSEFAHEYRLPVASIAAFLNSLDVQSCAWNAAARFSVNRDWTDCDIA